MSTEKTGPDFTLTVLGSRGSMAYGHPDCAVFGGNSSCYMLRAGEETIFLDAGSGLLSAPREYPRPPVILLSHLHLDHVIGLGMFPGLSTPLLHPKIYLPFCQDAEMARDMMDRLYSPPFWPLRLEDCESRPQLLPMPERLAVGRAVVDAMPGNHPGGSMTYRVRYRGKSVVYATDCEYGGAFFDALSTFSRDADLLLYDAQYDELEYLSKKGFGHSTEMMALELRRLSGAKRLLLIHHDPRSTDRLLLQRERTLPVSGVSFAREGQRIDL